MVLNQKDLQKNEPLKRSVIRTMKKDIKWLKRIGFAKQGAVPYPAKQDVQFIDSGLVAKEKIRLQGSTIVEPKKNQDNLESPIDFGKKLAVPKAKVNSNLYNVTVKDDSGQIQEKQAPKEITKELKEQEITKPQEPYKEPYQEPYQEPYKEKAYLSQVPLAVREKLKASTKVEEEKRKKFIEEVEEWVALHSKNKEGEKKI